MFSQDVVLFTKTSTAWLLPEELRDAQIVLKQCSFSLQFAGDKHEDNILLAIYESQSNITRVLFFMTKKVDCRQLYLQDECMTFIKNQQSRYRIDYEKIDKYFQFIASMSRIITNTNIIVDDFDFCKSFPKSTFHHFLTHFHSDHYEGLSPLWDYSDIHCTHQTKIFLLDKFPKLKGVRSYDYNKLYSITLVKDRIEVQFTFFDAKHIPGAAMILFRGYMGTILFTGDFRYEYSMVKDNSSLFPLSLRNHQTKQEIVEQMSGISIKIDQMIFDNTYCNEAFNFQREQDISGKMIRIIEKNRKKKLVYIAMGALGKHRILMKIGQFFQTSIVVTQKQLNKIKLANLRTDFLTTDPSLGFIHLISKKNRAEIIQKTKKGPLGEHFICIDTDFLMLDHQSPDQINYIVPYSLHSNYKEMQTFIRMIQPCILRKIVIPFANFRQVKLRIKIDHRLKFSKYLDYLEKEAFKSHSGYSYLVKNYTAIHELSKQYLQWFYPHQQKKLMSIFQLGSGEQNHDLRKRKPILLSEEEMSSRQGISKNKKKLKDIADQLNAVNKNRTLQKAFDKGKQVKIQGKFKSIFQNETWEYTNSLTASMKRSPGRSVQQLKKKRKKVAYQNQLIKSQSLL